MLNATTCAIEFRFLIFSNKGFPSTNFMMKLILFVILATICGICATNATTSSDGGEFGVRFCADLSAPPIKIN